MTAWLSTLLAFALTVSAVTLCALVLTPMLRNRISARSLYLAWLAVLVCALIPIRPFSPRPAVTLSPAPVARAVEVPVFAPRQTDTPVAPVSQPAAAGFVPVYTGSTVSASSAVQPARTLQWSTVLCMVYLTGAALMLLGSLAHHARYLRMLRRWRKPISDRRILALYDALRDEMGIRRTIPIYLCQAVDSPMIAGIFRPCILLPENHLNLSELRLVLRHELTHYQRGDLYVKLLELLCVSLHWYNPLIYLARREIDYACEASCDERVMRGASLDDRQYYSETIITVIRRQRARGTVLSTSFYGGKRGMKNRILTIMDTRARRLGALLLCPVLVMALAFSVAFAAEPSAAGNDRDVPSLAALMQEPSQPMTEDEAYEKGLQLLQAVRGSDFPADASAERAGVAFTTATFGSVTLPVVRADIRVQGSGRYAVSYWHAYLSAATGEGLLLTCSGEEASADQEFAAPYYLHPMLEDNQEQRALFATLPRAAYVSNAAAPSANFSEGPTDYTWPQGTCLNGTPVTVTELHLSGNNVPKALTEAKLIYWAKITVGATKDSPGVDGSWIPLCVLTFADEMTGAPATLPAGTVTTDAATGQVSLYAACDRDKGVVTVLSKGTQVEVLSRLAQFYQVRAGKDYGFLPIENLAFNTATQALMDSIVPEHFAEIQPGMREKYDEFMNRITALWDEYGDSNEWPLEIKAKATQIRLDYGFDADLPARNILPGEGDMTLEQATAFADAHIKERYGMTEADFVYRRYSFYYEPDAPDVHLWNVYYVARTGLRNCAVTFNQQGEILRDFQNSYTNGSGPDDLDMKQPGYYIDYGKPMAYTEDDEALAALDTAWQTLEATVDDGQFRQEDYTVRQELCRDICPDNDGSLTWWRFTFCRDDEEAEFYVIVVRGDDERVISSNAEDYAYNRRYEAASKRMAQEEALRGPYYTWSVEEKAEAASWAHEANAVLPTKQDIPQKKAQEIALAYAVEQTGDKLEKLANLPCYFYFETAEWYESINPAKTIWRVDINISHGYDEGMVDYLSVIMDSRSGEILEYWDSRVSNG